MRPCCTIGIVNSFRLAGNAWSDFAEYSGRQSGPVFLITKDQTYLTKMIRGLCTAVKDPAEKDSLCCLQGYSQSVRDGMEADISLLEGQADNWLLELLKIGREEGINAAH